MDSNNSFMNLLNSPNPQTKKPQNTSNFRSQSNNQDRPNFESPTNIHYPNLQRATQVHVHPNFGNSSSTFTNFPYPPNSQVPNFFSQEYFNPSVANSYMNGYYNSHPSVPKDTIDQPQIPACSTQEGLENNVLDGKKGNKAEASQKNKWSKEEEKLLVSSWLVVSTDSAVGNSQQGKDFWRRIGEYYNKYRDCMIERPINVLKSRWFLFVPKVNDFNQCYIRMKKEHHSGWSDDQVKDAARELYFSTNNKKSFKYEHVWLMLKDEPKWNSGNSTDQSSKRTKISASGAYSSSSDVQTSINIDEKEKGVRPIGQKAAKRKGKEKTLEKNKIHSEDIIELISSSKETRDSKINEINDNIRKMEEELAFSEKIKGMEILSKVTQGMNEEELHYHKMLCDVIKAKYNI